MTPKFTQEEVDFIKNYRDFSNKFNIYFNRLGNLILKYKKPIYAHIKTNKYNFFREKYFTFVRLKDNRIKIKVISREFNIKDDKEINNRYNQYDLHRYYTDIWVNNDMYMQRDIDRELFDDIEDLCFDLWYFLDNNASYCATLWNGGNYWNYNEYYHQQFFKIEELKEKGLIDFINSRIRKKFEIPEDQPVLKWELGEYDPVRYRIEVKIYEKPAGDLYYLNMHEFDDFLNSKNI